MNIPEMSLEPPEPIFVDYEEAFLTLADILYEEYSDAELLSLED